MPRGREKYGSLARVAVFGVAGVFLWRLAQRTPSEVSLVAGRQYEFTLLAHPYGDEAEWWQAARDALVENGASFITKIEASPGDVKIRFQKASPLTTTLPPHTVLYPSTPPLATATLLTANTLPA